MNRARSMSASIAAVLFVAAGSFSYAATGGDARLLEQGLQAIKSNAIALLKGGATAGPHRMNVVKTEDAWCESYLTGAYQPIEIDPSPEETTVRSALRAADLKRLAQIYTDPNSRYCKDGQVLARVCTALDGVLDMYQTPAAKAGNWYHWLIAIPGSLGAVGLLLENDLPPPQMARLIKTLDARLGKMVLTGANASWEARNHIYLALLTGNETRLSEAARRVVVDVRYGNDGGVLEDYAYVFHGRIPYAGAYGTGFAQTVASFIYLFNGTPWQIEPRKVSLIENLLLEHTRWYITGDRYDIHINGRSYRNPLPASQTVEALLLLSRCTSPKSAELRAACKALISQGAGVTVSVASWADELMVSDVQESFPSGFRFWYTAEMGAYNTKDFHVGFRQYCNRMQDYEFLTLKGGDGWNLAMGATWIMRTDGAGSWYDGADLSTDINMEFLPSVTSREGANPINPLDKGIDHGGFGGNFGTSPFSGGCGWRTGGVSGFILIPPYGDIVARKSLHFSPEGYWAIGSGISATCTPAPGAGHVRTTVLQWRPGARDIQLQVSGDRTENVSTESQQLNDVKWIWIDGVGIHFAEPVSVWHRQQNGAVTIWLDHGMAPTNAAYAFAVLPHSSLQETMEFSRNPAVKPLQTDHLAHVVGTPGAGRMSAVFFEAGSFGSYSVEQPLVLYHETGAEGDVLCLQDPLHTEKRLIVKSKLQGRLTYHDPEITVNPASNGYSVIEVDTKLGRIYRLGTGGQGAQVSPEPREDLAGLYQFKVAAESTPKETVLSFTLPPTWRKDSFRISIHGRQGHHLVYLDEVCDMEVVSENVVRYRWTRALDKANLATSKLNQRSGDFRAWYETDLALAVSYFSIPFFNESGDVVKDPKYILDMDNPARRR
jgi:hypothetical protein